MKHIEVGMLVRVRPATKPGWEWASGRVAVVKNQCPVIPGNWDLDGLEFTPYGAPVSFGSKYLEPINPDNESSSWEEVQKLTNWNPMGVEA